MEINKLKEVSDKILEIWLDLESANIQDKSPNEFMAYLTGYNEKDKSTRLFLIKQTLQEYMGFVEDEYELDRVTDAIRKMDIVETYIQKNGMSFEDLESIETLSDMGNVTDTMLQGRDFDALYNFISNIVVNLNPYGRGESRRGLSLGQYLTRFGTIDEVFAIEGGVAGRYVIRSNPKEGILNIDAGVEVPLAGTSLDIAEYWFNETRAKANIERMVMVEAWGYNRIPGARGGKGTTLRVNGYSEAIKYKEKSLGGYKYLYTLFDNSVMVYLV